MPKNEDIKIVKKKNIKKEISEEDRMKRFKKWMYYFNNMTKTIDNYISTGYTSKVNVLLFIWYKKYEVYRWK